MSRARLTKCERQVPIRSGRQILKKESLLRVDRRLSLFRKTGITESRFYLDNRRSVYPIIPIAPIMESSLSPAFEPSLSLPVSERLREYRLNTCVGLGLGLQSHLREDRTDVSFNRSRLNEQFFGNSCVRKTTSHAVENFTFSLCQARKGIGSLGCSAYRLVSQRFRLLGMSYPQQRPSLPAQDQKGSGVTA